MSFVRLLGTCFRSVLWRKKFFFLSCFFPLFGLVYRSFCMHNSIRLWEGGFKEIFFLLRGEFPVNKICLRGLHFSPLWFIFLLFYSYLLVFFDIDQRFLEDFWSVAFTLLLQVSSFLILLDLLWERGLTHRGIRNFCLQVSLILLKGDLFRAPPSLGCSFLLLVFWVFLRISGGLFLVAPL